MKNTTLKTFILTLLTFVFIVFSCTKDDEEATSDATSIELVSGDNQTADAGVTLENPIEVLVKDQFGHTFAETVVHFTPSDGSVYSPTVKTDARGIASILWTVGDNSGEQTLSVTAFKTDGTTPLDGSPMTIFANAEEALGAHILINISGNDQSGTVNETLANPIVVRVLDQFENPFAGAIVNFVALDGSVSAASGISDANGNVSVNWTLGSLIGTQNLTVTAFKADGTTPLDGSPMTLFANASTPLAIGDFHEGGIIFYLDNTGEHGLVCAITDQDSNAEWGCTETEIAGADGTTIGTGAQNTQDILAGCQASLIAAEWCSTLSLNSYSDWFLPSKDELNELFIHKSVVDATAITFGGAALQTGFYWSSTEINADRAWGYNVSGDDNKNNMYSVRAVRAF